MIAASILPAVFLTLANQTLVILICCFGMRIAALRIPLMLILVSTALDVLTSELVMTEAKTLGIDTGPLARGVGQILDNIGELLSLVGVAWLIVFALRYKNNVESHLGPGELLRPGTHE